MRNRETACFTICATACCTIAGLKHLNAEPVQQATAITKNVEELGA